MSLLFCYRKWKVLCCVVPVLCSLPLASSQDLSRHGTSQHTVLSFSTTLRRLESLKSNLVHAVVRRYNSIQDTTSRGQEWTRTRYSSPFSDRVFRSKSAVAGLAALQRGGYISKTTYKDLTFEGTTTPLAWTKLLLPVPTSRYSVSTPRRVKEELRKMMRYSGDSRVLRSAFMILSGFTYSIIVHGVCHALCTMWLDRRRMSCVVYHVTWPTSHFTKMDALWIFSGKNSTKNRSKSIQKSINKSINNHPTNDQTLIKHRCKHH